MVGELYPHLVEALHRSDAAAGRKHHNGVSRNGDNAILIGAAHLQFDLVVSIFDELARHGARESLQVSAVVEGTELDAVRIQKSVIAHPVSYGVNEPRVSLHADIIRCRNAGVSCSLDVLVHANDGLKPAILLVAEIPKRMANIVFVSKPVRRGRRNHRSRVERNHVAHTQRPFDDRSDRVTDFDVLPIAGFGPARFLARVGRLNIRDSLRVPIVGFDRQGLAFACRAALHTDRTTSRVSDHVVISVTEYVREIKHYAAAAHSTRPLFDRIEPDKNLEFFSLPDWSKPAPVRAGMEAVDSRESHLHDAHANGIEKRRRRQVHAERCRLAVLAIHKNRVVVADTLTKVIHTVVAAAGVPNDARAQGYVHAGPHVFDHFVRYTRLFQ